MSYRMARLAAGKKITEVADYMKVSTVSVWQWESGINNPTTDKLLRLAEFYGCTTDELLRDNPCGKKEERTDNAKVKTAES